MENNNNVFKPLVDIDCTGVIWYGYSSMYIDGLYLNKMLSEKLPNCKNFAGRVRLIVEDYTQSTGIPEPEEKKEESENESV
nr:MAG TPA: hypothetical protein [Ackermannviridae sp. ctjwt21]